MADESIIADLKSQGFDKLIQDLSLSAKGFTELDKSMAEAQEDAAYGIAMSIKRKGITPTRFFDDAITATFNKDFINVLGKALAADVSLKIIPTNGNNN